MSGQQFAKSIGISRRQLGRLEQCGAVAREADGTFAFEKAIQQLFTYYRRRLVVAERLCRMWCPGELDAQMDGYFKCHDDETEEERR